MTSFTPGGLPFPDGTDYVVDGDNAIHALADELDGQIWSMWRLAAGASRPLVSGSIAWDGVKSGPDASVLSADKTVVTLARTGLYRVESHLGLGAGANIGTSSALWVNGAVFGESQMYGNAGAAGVYVARPTVYITAVGGTTTIQQRATAQLGIYDWTWMRLTYLRKVRT